MIKNAFYFILKALLILKIFKFKANLEIHDVTIWLTSNFNTDIGQYLTN